jgi:putative membrane protein
MSDPLIGYCSPAAVPENVWVRWNADPVLILVLAAVAVVVGRGRVADVRAGWGAIALMVLIFVSPLCAISSALFSARAVHHVLVIAALAPLLALAFPVPRLVQLPLAVLVGAHTGILWLWHAPGAYAWGLASVPGYWLMQASLLGSAWLVWRAILAPQAQPGPALVVLGATIAQMGLLAALIVFAPQPLYLVHSASATAWGLSPLADQQLGGAVMWVPAILPYLGFGLWLAWSSLRLEEPTA